MKVLVTAVHFDTMCQRAMKLLKDNGVEVVYNQTENPYFSFEQMKELVGDIDGCIAAMEDWNEQLFECAPNLKILARFGVGINNFDLEAAKRHGVKCCNAKGANSNAVAEFAVSILLDRFRYTSMAWDSLRNGEWNRRVGHELYGKTIGLLGFGDIAGKLAKKLSGWDMKILAYDLFPNYEKAKELGVTIVSKEELFAQSDIVSIHVPDMPSTYHLVDRDAIAQMKDGAFILNVTRGKLMDTEALCDAVDSGHISGAALDVFEQEPLPEDARVKNTPNIFCTPHCAAETYEVYDNVSLFTAQQCLDCFAGKEPANWLNK